MTCQQPWDCTPANCTCKPILPLTKEENRLNVMIEDEENLAALKQEVKDLTALLRDIHKAVARGDHGPEMNASCIIDAIVTARMDCDEETKRADDAEKRVQELEQALAKFSHRDHTI